jgi:hypothetical protein
MTEVGTEEDEVVFGAVVAVEAGGDIESYLACVNAGVAVGDVVALLEIEPTALEFFARSVDIAGCSWSEVLDARSVGDTLDVDVAVGEYCSARTLGSTHKEVCEVISRMLDIPDYMYARYSGATHRELMRVVIKGKLRARDYSELRAGGAQRRQAKRLIKLGCDVSGYGTCRAIGDSHRQAARLLATCSSVDGYIRLRSQGSTRRQAWRLLEMGAWRP